MTYTHLEDYIVNLYKIIGISEPEQLKVAEIAQKIGVKLHYSFFSLRYDNNIVLKKSTKQKEWQEFGHELCHYLTHNGNHLKMLPLFRDFQEWKAESFAYHFCVPTFMLDNLKEVNVNVIMNLFNVDYDFALRRLEIYQNKQYGRMMVGAMRKSHFKVRAN